ncbi:MAG: hypothetical protein OEY67_08100 [Gammaproteobacteria bacterium]|nr:hypothetical protein [Gammaproteobacteria bacterium]
MIATSKLGDEIFVGDVARESKLSGVPKKQHSIGPPLFSGITMLL